MSAVTVSSKILGKAWADYYPEVTFNIGKLLRKMTDDEFFEFCRENPELRIEMDKRGGIEIMPPTGSETGGRNFTLAVKFGIWVEKTERAKALILRPGFACRTARSARPICLG